MIVIMKVDGFSIETAYEQGTQDGKAGADDCYGGLGGAPDYAGDFWVG